MSDLRTLYQSLIMDHGRNPRNKRPMDEHGSNCRCQEGYNPLCGDKLKLYARTDGQTLQDLSFDGEGCAIFTASSSMLTEVLKGRSVEEVRGIVEQYLAMLMDEDSEVDVDGLGKLAVFGGVKEFPARVKCATLPWRALEAILASVDGDDDVTLQESVATE